jgi:undecaprenyl-diphosphatase
MTTFQAVIYAIIHGVTEFLPLSAQAHDMILSYLIEWPRPELALQTAFSLGSFFALFLYFRHDWASMISCLLQVIIFRRKPMTADERLPLFILLSITPMAFVALYLNQHPSSFEWTPLWVACTLGGVALPLAFFDYWNRKIKNMCDWNWVDASIIGIAQATALFPGWDPLSGILLGAFFLNYKREPAVKYAFFVLTPILATRAILGLKEIDFHAGAPTPELSWLSFGVALVITFFVSLLIVGGFLKQVQQRGIGKYLAYRCLLSLAVVAFYWHKG